MQREDMLSSRRLEKQPASLRRRHPSLPSDGLALPVRTERMGWAKREKAACQKLPEMFQGGGELARRVGCSDDLIPHVDPSESRPFARGLFCLSASQHLGQQRCQPAQGSKVKRFFKSMTLGIESKAHIEKEGFYLLKV